MLSLASVFWKSQQLYITPKTPIRHGTFRIESRIIWKAVEKNVK